MNPRRRRVLQSAGSDSAAAPSNVTITRCSSEALGNATFNSPPQRACADASSYSFFLLTMRPSNNQIARICRTDACRTTMDAIRHAVPSDCQLPNGGAAMFLYRDILEPVAQACASGHLTSSSSSGRGDGNVEPPVQSSTESSSPGGIRVGAMIAMVVGAIVCGLLAAFITSRLKRKRLEEVLRSEPSHGQDSIAPLEDTDAFSSQRNFAAFKNAAESSNISSNPSRASTTHSPDSYTDGDLVDSSFETVEMILDDPALVMIRIPIAKVQVGALVSQGGFGQVYAGTYDHQLPVAIKKLLPGRSHDVRDVGLFLEEAKVLARLSHPRIEKLVGVAWDPSDRDPYLLTEFVAGGDLRAVLDRFAIERQLVGFSLEKVRIALHVAEALHFLHAQAPIVLHRDLKSRNVLVTPQLNAFLSDVGVLRDRETRSADYFSGSLWTAPEVVMGERYTDKADVFSFGVLLSEIDTHNVPYTDALDQNGRALDTSMIHHQVLQGTLRVSFSERADPDMVALGKQCLAVRPRDRPSARELFQRVNRVMKSYVAFV